MTLVALLALWMPGSVLVAGAAAVVCRGGHAEDLRLGFTTDPQAATP